MSELLVSLPHHRYPVIVKRNCLDDLASFIKSKTSTAAIIADTNVWPIVGSRLTNSFKTAGLNLHLIEQPSGEDKKNLETIKQHYESLISLGLERSHYIIALGGGVVGDTAGFAAASYLRGLPFVQCPTSLLAMVDASVGGKVGVNLKQGKNLVGAFYQPEAVFIDPTVLSTLPQREFRSGLAECIKHAVIKDSELFDWTEKNISKILKLDLDLLEELIFRNVKIKAEIVQADEKENNIRALLNLGHTFAHAIEATLGYGVIGHGEAVGLGLIAASRLGSLLGKTAQEVEARIVVLLEKAGLPTKYKLPEPEKLLAAMYTDKKVSSGKLRFVLPLGIGAAQVFEVDQTSKILESLKAIA